MQTFSLVSNPYPTVDNTLKQLYEIIEEIEKRKGTVTRIHAHGVAAHHLCYKGTRGYAKKLEDVWADGEESLVAGIITAYTMCCNTTSIAYSDVKRFLDDLTGVQEKITVPDLKIMKGTPPIVEVSRNGWKCLTGLNLVCPLS